MLRLNKDLAELDVPEELAHCDFTELKKHKRFKLMVFPDEESFWYFTIQSGIYRIRYKGKYEFTVDFGSEYPHKPPKCMCLTKVKTDPCYFKI